MNPRHQPGLPGGDQRAGQAGEDCGAVDLSGYQSHRIGRGRSRSSDSIAAISSCARAAHSSLPALLLSRPGRSRSTPAAGHSAPSSRWWSPSSRPGAAAGRWASRISGRRSATILPGSAEASLIIAVPRKSPINRGASSAERHSSRPLAGDASDSRAPTPGIGSARATSRRSRRRARGTARLGGAALRPGPLPPRDHPAQLGHDGAAVAAADDLEMPALGPEEDRGMPVPAVERHPLIAGVALEILLGLDVRERFRIEDLVLLDRQLADR